MVCWKYSPHQILLDVLSRSLTMIRLNTSLFCTQKDMHGQDLSLTSSDPPWRLKGLTLLHGNKWKAIAAVLQSSGFNHSVGWSNANLWSHVKLGRACQGTSGQFGMQWEQLKKARATTWRMSTNQTTLINLLYTAQGTGISLAEIFISFDFLITERVNTKTTKDWLFFYLPRSLTSSPFFLSA